MAAELVVNTDTSVVNAGSETSEDVKNVLFHLGTILHSTDSSTVAESTVSGPTVPTKSSSEILSELFSAFNAEPPNIPENFPEPEPRPSPSSLSENSGDEPSVESKNRTHRTGRKHKHKHKKHKHKHKKRIKQENSDNLNLNSFSGEPRPSSLIKTSVKEEGGVSVLGLESKIASIGLPVRVKKEKVRSKSSTRPRSKHSRHTKGLRSVKLKHVTADPKSSRSLGLSIKISNDLTYDQDHSLKSIHDVELPSANPQQTRLADIDEINRPTSPVPKSPLFENITPKIKIEPGTEPTEKQPSTSTNEPSITVGTAKNTSKISIKSLKFSSVFEATVREVEEQAKAKANKYEEGELSNSDCDELVLSPISSIESVGNETVASTSSFYHSSKKKVKKSKKRHRSESGERSASHHLSKHRKNSKSERESKISNLSTSSCHLKHHDKHKHKRDRPNEEISKKKCKRQYSNEKHCLESRSTSKSPKRKLKKNANKSGIHFKEATHSKPLELNNTVIVSSSGRKTVEELTNFCKRLSRKEQAHNRSDTEEDEECGSDSETEQPFHHPFQVKERPQSIIVNIRNSIQLPVKSLQEKAADQSKQLRVQFPVSSGQRHRKAEDEWVPVSPKRNKSKVQSSAPDMNIQSTLVATPVPVSGIAPVKDIGSIVTQKLRAMRTLQENPNDVEALGAMFRANQDMLHWAEAKQNQQPTATDTSGLTATGETANPQTTTPMPVCSGRVGMGMSLLQKMGWKPGEGLGKNREGVLEPLKLEIKMDKKGLITAEDMKASPKHAAASSTGQPTAHCKPTTHNIVQSQDKHPVNKLVEFCMRKRWRGPQFELCHESGPDHRKNFLFKVVVNGTEYKPMVTSLTKKQAKTEAASICLQALRDLN